MIEVEGPNGVIVEFPDGTPRGVMERAMRERFSSSKGPAVAPAAATPTAPAQAAPAEPDWTDTIMSGASAVGGVLDQGARGIAEGVTNLLGLPGSVGRLQAGLIERGLTALGAPDPVADAVSSITSLTQYLPTGEDMQAGGDFVNETIADAAGVAPPRAEPDNVAERFANRVGEEVGAAAVPTAGVLGRANTLRRTFGDEAPRVARESGPISRMFVEPATVNPGRFVGNETTMAVGAGMGAATANEMFPGSAVADVGGAIAGAGLTGLGGMFGRGVGETASALFRRQGYVDDVVRDAVVDRLSESAGLQTAIGEQPDTTSLVRTIENGPRISNVVPGVQETLADRTRNSGLAALEYSRQSGPNSGLFAQRRNDNAGAMDTAISRLEPGGNPAALRDEVALERARRLTDAEIAAVTAGEDAERVVGPLRPTTTPTERGNTVRSALEEARERTRESTRGAYERVGLEGNTINPSEFVAHLEQTVSGLSQAQQSLLPEPLIDRIRGLGETGGLNEATGLRTVVLELAREAGAKPGGREEARVLGLLERSIDDFIGQNVTPEQRSALDTARTARFNEAERFDRQGDPVNRALQRYPGGQPKMADERVAKSFKQPQAMDRLFAEADTPETRSAIREEVLSRLDSGRAENIEQFLGSNAEQVRRFPGLDDELRRAAEARKTEAAATTARDEAQRTLGTDERRGTSTVGRYLDYGPTETDRAVQEVLRSRDPVAAADELLTFVNDDPQAVRGAQQALWDQMKARSQTRGRTTRDIEGQQQWSPVSLKQWLDDPTNRAVADRLYRDNPKHIENLRIIAEALQGLGASNAGKVPNNSGTAQSILPSAETAASRLFAYQRGQVGAGWLISSLAAMVGRRAVRGARSDAIERMLDEVLLEPDAAALLLQENNPANRAALRRYAKTWFGNEAATIMNALSADDEDETTNAAMGAN